MRFTLNNLSRLVPDWLAGQLQPEWANRYGPRADDYRLPYTKAKRLEYAQQIGQDGFWLMEQIERAQQAAYFWQLGYIFRIVHNSPRLYCSSLSTVLSANRQFYRVATYLSVEE